MMRVLVLVVLVLLGLAGEARAQEVRRAGTVRLEVGPGGRGPLALGITLTGEFSIVNEGKEPLVVSRIAVFGEGADPRVPPKLNAHLAEGALPVTIPPGASRRAVVQWSPDKGVKVHQLFGHVVVATSDEQTGEVAMGVHATLATSPITALGDHVLSLLVGLPILGVFAIFLARAAGKKEDRTAHLIASVALSVQVALAVCMLHAFVPDVTRLDGNDGLQLIEHAVWIRPLGAEIFLGMDGIGAVSLFVFALVALLAFLPERAVPRGVPGYHAAYLVLAAAVPGALVAMDGLLFVLFAALAVASATLLVGGWGGDGRRTAASRLAVFGGLAVALVLVALVAASRNTDASFLVDGTKVGSTFSLTELSRASLGGKGATLLGGAVPKVGFLLVLLASLVFLGAFPLHSWLAPVLVEAPTGAGALIGAAMPMIGTTILLRIGCCVFPEGMRWGSGVVVALGAVGAGYGALASMGQSDLRRLAAFATTSQVGFALLGAGSLTPQGISGAVLGGGVRALACALFLVLTGAVDARARTRDIGRLEGVAAQMPGWGAAMAAASLAQAGVLGTSGAWGPLLSLLGAVPNYAPLAIVAAIALVVAAVAHLFAVARFLFGALSADWQKNPLLEPFGGRFPDLTAREWAAVLPLAVLVIGLGIWPAPLLSATTGTVRDITNAVSPPGPDQIAGL